MASISPELASRTLSSRASSEAWAVVRLGLPWVISLAGILLPIIRIEMSSPKKVAVRGSLRAAVTTSGPTPDWSPKVIPMVLDMTGCGLNELAD